MTGIEISSLRVFMSRNGKIRPVPFQIDQKGSTDDWIWSAVYDADKVDDGFNEEESEQTVRQENLTYDDQDPPGKSIFDNNDVIVFLAIDAGDKDRKSIMRLGADKLLELKITDPVNQTKGWVYLAHFESDAPAISDIRYVQYDPEKLRVSGPEHEFLYSLNQTMILDDFKLGGVSVLAGNRIRGEVNFSRAEVDGVVKPVFLGNYSVQRNLLAENIKAEWIELAGKSVSVISSVKIPQQHKRHLDVAPYLIDAKPVSGVEVGFLIRTTDKAPDGDHVIHSVFLFTANSNREKFLANAIELLQQKLVVNTVMLVQ